MMNEDLYEKQRRRSQRQIEREASDIRFILKSPEGRRFFWRIMDKGLAFADPFANNDTNLTNYLLGKQSVGRYFFNELINIKPDSYIQMIQEREAIMKDDERQEEIDRKESDIMGN